MQLAPPLKLLQLGHCKKNLLHFVGWEIQLAFLLFVYFILFFILRDVQNPDEESTINLLACPQGRDYGTIMYFPFGSTFVTVNFVFTIGEFHGTFLYLKCCWFKTVLGQAFDFFNDRL